MHRTCAIVLAHAPGSIHLDRRIVLDVDDRVAREHAGQPQQDFGDETAPVGRVDEYDVETARIRRGEEV